MSAVISGKRLITAEQLAAMPGNERCELIDGEIIRMAPTGAEHGGVAGQVFGLIWNFASKNKLGRTYAAETGFLIKRNPDMVRAPDVAFVQTSRLPPTPVAGYFDGPPDLAVEVCSPNDRLSDVIAKVDQWLAAGAISVWVVDPPSRSIEIYRRDSQPMRYHVGQQITDEPALPGFVFNIDDAFR